MTLRWLMRPNRERHRRYPTGQTYSVPIIKWPDLSGGMARHTALFDVLLRRRSKCLILALHFDRHSNLSQAERPCPQRKARMYEISNNVKTLVLVTGPIQKGWAAAESWWDTECGCVSRSNHHRRITKQDTSKMQRPENPADIPCCSVGL